MRRLTAIPAQSDAELAVRTRQQSPRPDELDEALRDGRLLRTFAFRGAVHLLTPEEGGAYLALRAAGRQWELPSWQEYYGLAPHDWPAFREAVREALDDHPLTPAELGAALSARPRYEHLREIFANEPWTLLKALAWQGDLTFGPSRDGEPTFQLLAHNPRWAGSPGPRRRGSARDRGLRAGVRPHDSRPSAVLARSRPERRPPADPGVDHGAG